MKKLKFAIVQITRPQQKIYYLTHDPLRTLLYSLESLGHDVICTRNSFAKDRINILATAYNLDSQNANILIKSKVNYVVYQTEVLSAKGINVFYDKTANVRSALGGKKAIQTYLRVLSNSRMVWDCFSFNKNFLSKLNIDCGLIRHGYHPNLEGQPKKQNLDLDLLFFGSLTPYRKRILDALNKKGYKLAVLSLEPPLFRDDCLRRTKLNLSIRANPQGMSHLPHFRVLTGLYHHTLTVSEICSEQKWMEDMVMMVPPEQLVETCDRILQSGEWEERAQKCRANFLQKPMTEYLRPLVARLDEKMDKGEYAIKR